MNKNHTFLLSGALILLAPMIMACDALAQENRITKSFDNIEEVDIDLRSGDLKLVKGTGTTVEIEVVYTFDEANYNPEFTKSGKKLEIDEKMSRGTYRGSSSWEIKIPDGLEVRINNGSGDVEIASLRIDIDINTGSGDMNFKSVDGEMSINSGSGDIEFESQKGTMKVNTGSGDVDMRNSNMEGANINSGSGNVYLESSRAGFSVNTGSGNIRAENVTISDASGFNTGSGDAEVQLATRLENNISVSSGSGDAELDFGGNAISGEVTMKATKSNGEIIAPFDFDKTEEEQNGRNTILKKTVKIGSGNVQIYVGTGSGRAVIRE